MVPLAEEIYRTRRVTSKDGSTTLPIDSETPVNVTEFLKKLVAQTGARKTAEVGLAYGLSAMSICEGLRENGGSKHVAIDPNQSTQWGGIGLENVRRAGFADLLELRETPSYLGLPRMIEEGIEIDFAFIDGWHTFDYALVDFFNLDLLLRVGGIIAIDDCFLASVRSVCRYIARNRAYRVIGVSDDITSYRTTTLRRIAERAARLSATVQGVVKSEFLDPDLAFGFTRDTRCIAFQKLAPDTRSWDTHNDF